jgi:anti-anti-sigma regulatory factor
MSFAALDFLARLNLEARRRGVELRLRDVSPALGELLSLAGLDDVLVEVRRQPEEREERRGVEEEGQLPDHPA